MRLWLVFLLSCAPQAQRIAGQSMGTRYQVQYFPQAKTPSLPRLSRLVDDTLKELNRQMSTYREDSEIAKFNSSDSLDWMEISPDFHRVLKHSVSLAEKTRGLFDPTLAPLVNLWGFGPRKKKRSPPKTGQIQALKTITGYQNIELGFQKVRKKMLGVQIDLSASAKGFGVDKISSLLESHFVKDYLVEIGGEIKARGRKGNKAWKIAIESPDGKHKILKVRNRAVATSGDYRNFFEVDGKRYSHTINAKTGKPVEHRLASVTVLHENCLSADALATALMAMGPKRGFEFAKKEGLEAYFISRNGSKLVMKTTSGEP